jgi:hypothetical protein
MILFQLRRIISVNRGILIIQIMLGSKVIRMRGLLSATYERNLGTVL